MGLTITSPCWIDRGLMSAGSRDKVLEADKDSRAMFAARVTKSDSRC
jgi:hypothetical protein